jgi:hypothetical protein
MLSLVGEASANRRTGETQGWYNPFSLTLHLAELLPQAN